MEDWKKINIVGIAKIEKCVSEFEVSEYYISPWQTFKVKIYEDQNGKYTGVSNLQIRDEAGESSPFIGHGKTIATTLEDTLKRFFEITERKPIEEWTESDFEVLDSYNF